jgi:hypothetical protein
MRWCLWVSRSRDAVSNLSAWVVMSDFMSVNSAKKRVTVSCNCLILSVQVSLANPAQVTPPNVHQTCNFHHRH